MCSFPDGLPGDQGWPRSGGGRPSPGGVDHQGDHRPLELLPLLLLLPLFLLTLTTDTTPAPDLT